ncbi:MAG: bifunctional DNA-binding transcriptional regulator/O6-methylguanine-DNA methyltransferase Ada [Chloroflexota bacterium]
MDNTLPFDEDTLWEIFEQRDGHYSGRFVVGVRSTGIYCRPGCPARTPKRQNVSFYAGGEQAEAAGFRPCKRCRPQDAREPAAELVTRACRLIEEEGPLTLAELGRRVGASPWHLQRSFKAVTGVSPRQYAAGLRERALKDALRQGQPVSGALYDAGYGSHSRLYEGAPQRLGMTPGKFRRGGAAMEVRYTIVDCHLGRMLVAATAQGICAVSFADQDETLEIFLQTEVPAAHLQRDDAALQGWVQAILDYLDGRLPRLDLPLDVQATAFQRQVWEALRRIPYGETRTYTQVAAEIGRPQAVRAVAHACASNPVSLVTPCHRVIRSDGSLAGYRWGIARKQKLLQLERRQMQTAAAPAEHA